MTEQAERLSETFGLRRQGGGQDDEARVRADAQ
jgi:hypothetical protein